MKSNILVGEIGHETEKAVKVDGKWIGRGAIQEILPVEAYIDLDGIGKPWVPKKPEVVVIAQFPIVDCRWMGSDAVRTVSGRVFRICGGEWIEVQP
ncbi:MAG: hypothetical protein M1358_00615 [Chloroflexi bacterium]|nr:hypothetical protein [Chloroflexota bacterium]